MRFLLVAAVAGTGVAFAVVFGSTAMCFCTAFDRGADGAMLLADIRSRVLGVVGLPGRSLLLALVQSCGF